MTQQRQPLFVRLPFYFLDGIGEGCPMAGGTAMAGYHPDTAGLAAGFAVEAAHFATQLSFMGVRHDEK